jgi:hypothetical protein
MSEPDAASTQADLAALKALRADVSELERMESLLDRFNVFEAIGFVGQETMHSRFLAFLLDPNQNHSLGNLFLCNFLRWLAESTDEVSLSRVFDSADDGMLDQTTVETEVHTGDGRIDLLLSNEAGEWAMIVENKVWTTEHSDQLGRYYRYVEESYPSWQTFGVYLTPYGDPPSHPSYLPFGYRAVCEVVDVILEERDSVLSSYVRMSLKQYNDLVRRNIVSDSEVAELCQSIYRKHQRAFDMVFQHRFARQQTIRELLTRLVRGNDRLVYNDRWTDYPAEEYVTFGMKEWDVPTLRVAEDYTRTDRILLFSVWNWAAPYPDSLTLHLEIGPGDEETREKLLGMAENSRDIFEVAPKSPEGITLIYKRSLLGAEFYENTTNGQREREIRRQWAAFLEDDLPRIEEALRQEAWIWEPAGIDDR